MEIFQIIFDIFEEYKSLLRLLWINVNIIWWWWLHLCRKKQQSFVRTVHGCLIQSVKTWHEYYERCQRPWRYMRKYVGSHQRKRAFSFNFWTANGYSDNTEAWFLNFWRIEDGDETSGGISPLQFSTAMWGLPSQHPRELFYN